MNIGDKISLQDPALSCIMYVQRRIVALYGNIVLYFRGITILFSIVATPVIVPTIHRSSNFSIYSLTHRLFCFVTVHNHLNEHNAVTSVFAYIILSIYQTYT